MPDWLPSELQCTYEEALEQWIAYENDMEQMRREEDELRCFGLELVGSPC